MGGLNDACVLVKIESIYRRRNDRLLTLTLAWCQLRRCSVITFKGIQGHQGHIPVCMCMQELTDEFRQRLYDPCFGSSRSLRHVANSNSSSSSSIGGVHAATYCDSDCSSSTVTAASSIDFDFLDSSSRYHVTQPLARTICLLAYLLHSHVHLSNEWTSTGLYVHCELIVNRLYTVRHRPIAKGYVSERSDDLQALKGHFSPDCSSANILNIVRLWNRINKIE